jgi:hypothetical protein
MSDYDLIDSTLSEWATRHSLVWLTDYQGTDVRTFFLNPEIKEKIQVWVDPPKDGSTSVHVFQYTIGGKKKNSRVIQSTLPDLSTILDESLGLAKEWMLNG